MTDKAYRFTVVLLLSGILVVQLGSAILSHHRTPTVADLLGAGENAKAKGRVWARLPIVLLKGSLDTLAISGDVDVSGTVDVDHIRDTVDVSGTVDIDDVAGTVKVKVQDY